MPGASAPGGVCATCAVKPIETRIIVGKRPMPSVRVRLWSINKWLRWTGLRLFIGIPSGPDEPTVVGLVWYGWGFVGHERAKGRLP